MPAQTLPPCGIYRTTQPIGDIPADRLVYFHNHGEPGPGLYLPRRWTVNRAQFEEQGFTMPAPVERLAGTLRPLPAEGFYRVLRRFHCCEKKCTTFEPDLLVQVGYNGAGRAIVFVPELTTAGFAIPESGSLVDDDQLGNLALVKVADRTGQKTERASSLH